MLNRIEKFIREKLVIEDAGSPPSEQQLLIATTVLFLEIALADFELDPEEEHHIRQTLHDFFGLDAAEVDELLDLARESRNEQTDIWFFTNAVKNNFDRPQKKWIVQKLWELVYADGSVDKYEDNLIRKVSRLLGLDHGEMIEAKIKARERLGLSM